MSSKNNLSEVSSTDLFLRLNELSSEVTYGHTNECLESIILGLNPKGNVLSILGSGDQAFAMAEHASLIVGVDFNASQVEYATLRLEALKRGDFYSFFDVNHFYYEKIKKYFSDERLGRIRKRISSGETKLEFLEGDIFNTSFLKGLKQTYGSFDRLYLSNAIAFCHTHFNPEEDRSKYFRRQIFLFKNVLKPDALIYASETHNVGLKVHRGREIHDARAKEKGFNPSVYSFI